MTDNSPAGGDKTAPSEESTSVDKDLEEDRESNDEAMKTPTLPPRYHPPPHEEFDWRGWLLVGVILVSFLGIPGVILYLPHAQDLIARIGISWRQAYLTLPMIPALLLGGVAIWAAVSSRRSSE